MSNVLIRDKVIKHLKDDKDFDKMAVAKIEGNYFSGADISLSDKDGNCHTYRITIIKHSR